MEVVELFKQCKNIYDILAVAYSKLIPYEYSKVANCDFAKYKRISNALGMFLEENENEDFADISELIYTICVYIKNEPQSIDEWFYYNLIHQIDSVVAYKYARIGRFFSRYKRVGVLNTNGKALNVYVLPKMQDTIVDVLEQKSYKYEKTQNPSLKKAGLRRRSKKDNICSINSRLHNFVIYESNSYVPDLSILLDNNGLSNRILNKEFLRIGVVPFSKEKIENMFIIENQQDTFSISCPKDEVKSNIYNAFKEELRLISKDDLDIVIFPEMYLTEEIVKDLRGIIKEIYSSNQNKNTQLILAGTLWRNKSNRCYVR